MKLISYLLILYMIASMFLTGCVWGKSWKRSPGNYSPYKSPTYSSPSDSSGDSKYPTQKNLNQNSQPSYQNNQPSQYSPTPNYDKPSYNSWENKDIFGESGYEYNNRALEESIDLAK